MIPEIETQSLSEQKKYQEAQLPLLLQYVKKHSKFYSELFQKNNIDITKITIPKGKANLFIISNMKPKNP